MNCCPSVVVFKTLENSWQCVDAVKPFIHEPVFPGTSLQAFLSLAWFADSQYQKKVDFMSSSVYEDKEALMKKSKVRKKRPINT